MGASVLSLNPLGWALGLKGLYHASRGCEEEEKSLEIIYGDKYTQYKRRTIPFIPRLRPLFDIAKKVMPEKLIDYINLEPEENQDMEHYNPYTGYYYDI